MSSIETYEFMVEGVLMMVVTCIGIFFNIIRFENHILGIAGLGENKLILRNNLIWEDN